MIQDPGFAPAKINLTLHVTGQRPDGYHVLDSLVVFADVGDHIRAVASNRLTLQVTGPEAAGLPMGDDNLVMRAARALGGGLGADLVLDKQLPQASGIGGGSSDAAATLRVLAAMWGRALPSDAGLSLGADVPVCLAAQSARMSGVGEVLTPVPDLPPIWAVLVNPRVHVATPQVFRALVRRDNAPMPAVLPDWRDAQDLAAWLGQMRNDLEGPACALAPAVSDVLRAVSGLNGVLLARMSGSGATCFGLFADVQEATAGSAVLRQNHPEWWVRPVALGQSAPFARE